MYRTFGSVCGSSTALIVAALANLAWSAEVVLYEDAGAKGRTISVDVGDDMDDFGSLRSDVTDVRVPGNVLAVLYNRRNFKGDAIVLLYTDRDSQLVGLQHEPRMSGGNWGDVPSSIRTQRLSGGNIWDMLRAGRFLAPDKRRYTISETPPAHYVQNQLKDILELPEFSVTQCNWEPLDVILGRNNSVELEGRLKIRHKGPLGSRHTGYLIIKDNDVEIEAGPPGLRPRVSVREILTWLGL